MSYPSANNCVAKAAVQITSGHNAMVLTNQALEGLGEMSCKFAIGRVGKKQTVFHQASQQQK